MKCVCHAVTPSPLRRAGQLPDRVIDRQRGEVGFDHAEVVPGLVLLGRIRPFEEPEVDDADPGPLALRALVGLDDVVGLLLKGDLAEAAVGDGVGDGVPVHLADPDGLAGVAVADHDVAQQDVAGEVDLQRAGAMVAGAGEEAIALGLYCFLRYPNTYEKVVIRGANTNGDSDSIACIAGSISGACLGIEAIPPDWVRRIENSAYLGDLAQRLAAKKEAMYG